MFPSVRQTAHWADTREATVRRIAGVSHIRSKVPWTQVSMDLNINYVFNLTLIYYIQIINYTWCSIHSGIVLSGLIVRFIVAHPFAGLRTELLVIHNVVILNLIVQLFPVRSKRRYIFLFRNIFIFPRSIIRLNGFSQKLGAQRHGLHPNHFSDMGLLVSALHTFRELLLAPGKTQRLMV